MDDRIRRALAVEDPQQRLAMLLNLLVDLESTRSEVRTARDKTIRELHDNGVRIVDLVFLTGLTRARVNQILAGVR